MGDEVGDVVGLGLGDDFVGDGCGEEVVWGVVVFQVWSLGFEPLGDGGDLVLVDDSRGGQLFHPSLRAGLFALATFLLYGGPGVGPVCRPAVPVGGGGLPGRRRGLRRGGRAVIPGRGHRGQQGDGGQQTDRHAQYLSHWLFLSLFTTGFPDRAPIIRRPLRNNLRAV